MKTYLSIIIHCSLLFLLTACGLKPVPATYMSISDVAKQGDEAWNILVETANQYYPSLATVDKNKGTVRSVGVITDKCWVGIVYGGMVPCEMERLVLEVKSFSPFQVDLAVKRIKGDRSTKYQTWLEAGNVPQIQTKISEKLFENLNSSFRKPVTKNNGKEIVIEMPSYSISSNMFEDWIITQINPKLEKTIISKGD